MSFAGTMRLQGCVGRCLEGLRLYVGPPGGSFQATNWRQHLAGSIVFAVGTRNSAAQLQPRLTDGRKRPTSGFVACSGSHRAGREVGLLSRLLRGFVLVYTGGAAAGAVRSFREPLLTASGRATPSRQHRMCSRDLLLDLVELSEVGISECLPREDALLRVVPQQLLHELHTLRLGVWDQALDACSFLLRKVEIHMRGIPLEFAC
mmetsp:Transcript_105178/g.250397  ORF Transcript_105178/g.250397 Transcript_105178/m.250397 type:complete len:205 (+) Transcript_105178:477-1091(+)